MKLIVAQIIQNPSLSTTRHFKKTSFELYRRLRSARGILLLLLLLTAIELSLGDSSPYTSVHIAKIINPSLL